MALWVWFHLPFPLLLQGRQLQVAKSPRTSGEFLKVSSWKVTGLHVIGIRVLSGAAHFHGNNFQYYCIPVMRALTA
jgi:hypothetical protein